MILLFPNLDTLRLSLTSSIVPAEVTLAPAAVTFDDQGKIFVETSTALSRTVTKNLDRIGVKGSKRHATESPEELSCWLQVIPVERASETASVSSQAAVLFELSDADDLPVLAAEMLRLGNDRQSYRWFAAPGDGDSRRVLLRVVGPPYYTLLRALDPSAAGTKGIVRAYLERAPRVWVEIGYSHPLAPQIRVAEKQLVLLRSPRQWLFLDEAPFVDVYEILQIQLPVAPVEWTEAKVPRKFSVPLRLTAGNAADVPELWILRKDAIEQLDTLVRDSDDRLTQRLMFAVANDEDGRTVVVLRTRPSKLAPPYLPLENAVSFKPFWKLPNLFVPAGRRLHPTLRRDAVRKLLANDPDQVVWLYPDEKNGFAPQSVPDSAFRSLEDWVDYVIESEQSALAAWIESSRFDLEHFVCSEGGGPKSKPDKPDPKQASLFDDGEARSSRGASAQPKGKSRAAGRSSNTAEFLPPEEVKKPSEWKLRREELEKQFLAIDGSLDCPERHALWPQLAAASAGIPDETESAICWLNAAWGGDPIPPSWLAGWARAELPASAGPMKADELDKRLAQPSPGQKEARIVIAHFLLLASQNPVPGWLSSRLSAMQAYLEKHEGALPVRAVWLTAYRLSQLAGADVLGLARVRDRVLNRLLSEGLSAEKDLPGFLRYAGHKDSERMRVVREKAGELHTAIRKWSDHIPQNLPFFDLLFAFAMAKLQETSAAKKLVDDARSVLESSTPPRRHQEFDTVVSRVVRGFLFRAFSYRIDQVLSGKTSYGPLSKDLLVELDEISTKAKSKDAFVAQGNGLPQNPYWRAEYIINRLRHESRILEPQGTLHPYSDVTKHTNAIYQELAQLHGIRDNALLTARIRSLLKNGLLGNAIEDIRFLVLREGLLLAARVGETFTVELLAQVPAVIAAWPANGKPGFTTNRLKEQGELIERGMVLAAHFDRRDLVRKLVREFLALAAGKNEQDTCNLVNAVGVHSLRVMKKLGMRDEIDSFYSKLHSDILCGSSMVELRRRHSTKVELWAGLLQTMLNLAGGWLSLGFEERAEPIILEARNELLGAKSILGDLKDITPVAKAYVSALGHGNSDSGLARMTELFASLDPKRVTNTSTTQEIYSRFHLNLVEDVIRAIVSDDFALGSDGRKWLDEDEYLVRKRIHADMKRERESSGLV